MDTKMTTPPELNLFAYATSELSQDAFLCWLLARADDRLTDIEPSLRDASRRLLKHVLNFGSIELPPRVELEIIRQLGKIDVLVILNSHIGIIIEDKTYTSQHDDQLSRYQESLRELRPEVKDMICVYYKTGDQCSFDAVTKAGYSVIERKDFLSIVKPAFDAGVGSEVFNDYYLHVSEIERQVNGFADLPIGEWKYSAVTKEGNNNYPAWVGFFKTIMPSFAGDNVGWEYVSNPQGGFIGFWFHWLDLGTTKAKAYVQLEDSRLTYRVYNTDHNAIGDIPNRLADESIQLGRATGLAITRSKRIHLKESCAVAYLEGDYRQPTDSGKLDMNMTIEKLRRCTELLDIAVRNVG